MDNGWKSIESAPRFAGYILVWCSHMQRPYVVKWRGPNCPDDEVQYWGDAIQISHWQPVSPHTERAG